MVCGMLHLSGCVAVGGSTRRKRQDHRGPSELKMPALRCRPPAHGCGEHLGDLGKMAMKIVSIYQMSAVKATPSLIPRHAMACKAGLLRLAFGMKVGKNRSIYHCPNGGVALLIAGLTGGIATGKSTVARIMSNVGAVVVDADRIARQVVAPGLPAWQEIKDHLGEGILLADGTIDRDGLGKMVFADPEMRRWLEAVIHPRVEAQISSQISQVARTTPEAVVLLDIPLLFETGRDEGLSDIIVVYVPEKIQCLRLIKRDGLSRSEALARISAQMRIDEKVKRATIVIDNSGPLSDTEKQALAVYRRLARQAAQT
jgi:dephospho-CoA kinase